MSADRSSSSAGCVIKPHLQRLTPYLPPLDGRSANQHLLLDFNERINQGKEI